MKYYISAHFIYRSENQDLEFFDEESKCWLSTGYFVSETFPEEGFTLEELLTKHPEYTGIII